MRVRTALGAALFFVGWACAASLPSLTGDDAKAARERWHDVTVESLGEGRRLYARHCSGCHSLRSPEEYGPSEWPEKFSEMNRRAKLSGSDSVLVLRYLQAAALSREARAKPIIAK